jgi:DNA-binding transcriptional LysR family regulator
MFEKRLAEKGISLDRLKNFLAFADAKSIVEAAGRELSKQTLISRQIKELETFFGVELVKRMGRGLALTAAGSNLARIMREQFGALDDFAREAKAMPSTLSIVAPNSIATWLVMPRLAEIRRRLPHHRFVIQHEQTPAIIRGVLEGSHDIGFLRETAVPKALGRKALGGAGFALFVPKALAGRVNVKQPSTWLRLPLALPIGGMLRGSVDSLAAKEGIKLSPLLGCDSYVQAAAAVAGGAVASVLPLISEASFKGSNVQMIPLPEFSARSHRTLMLWSRRAQATRKSVADAVAVLPDLLTVD